MVGTGVYCWRNKIDGKRYVGSAGVAFRHREKDHLLRLKCGKHGEGNFVFEILERGISVAALWTDPDYRARQVQGRIGKKHSLAVRRKMALAQQARRRKEVRCVH